MVRPENPDLTTSSMLEDPGRGGGGTISPAGQGRRDFVVVGAGPAGSRAAERLAGRGASVLLMDPRTPWEKPCGGGLTAAALRNTPELRELSPHTQTIHELLVVAPGGASVVVPLRQPFQTVDRVRLGRWGLERAQAAGAEFLSRKVVTAERDREGWLILDEEGDVHRCRRLVAADGATSRLRRRLAPGFHPEMAPLRVAYPAGGAPAGRAVFRFLPATEGYLWDFPRPGRHSVGIGVPPGTFAKAALDGAIDQYRLGETGDRGAVPQGGAVIASSYWLDGDFPDLGGDDYALLGDAGGLADPATGEGIDYALRSADLAADAYDPDAGFRAYPATAKRAFGSEFRRSRALRTRLYRPEIAERLVRRARVSPRGALILMSLIDTVNEHRSLAAAAWRGVVGRIPREHAARRVCECPDGTPPRAGEPAGADAPSVAPKPVRSGGRE